MRIVHVIWAQYPLGGYGGTERVCYNLMKAQAELGHEVFALCLAGSHIPFAKTLEIPDWFDHLDPFLPRGTDFVQLYSTPSFRVDTPFLVNVGGNGQPNEEFSPNTVFVSESHAQRHGWSEFVYNGVDPDDYPLCVKKDTYALFLAKASWRVKNLRGSIRIAQAAGIPLYVAGGRAGCWHRGVISQGTVGGEKKLRMLQNARALLFPIIWEEPFGLAVVEALACGTPVVATPRGALPEIITPEVGVLADSFDELVAGLQNSFRIQPEACRERVLQCFTHRKMAEKYMHYYDLILKEGKIRMGTPKAPSDADPEKKTYYRGYV